MKNWSCLRGKCFKGVYYFFYTDNLEQTPSPTLTFFPLLIIWHSVKNDIFTLRFCMDSQRSNSRQHEHKFISPPLSTILFKTHLTLRTYLSVSKHFDACGTENKKTLENRLSKSKIFENVCLGVYTLQFSFNKRKVKEKGRIFLDRNNAAEARVLWRLFLFSKAMVHSCQRFHFLCLLIIIMTLIYFASAKFSQRTQKHEAFFCYLYSPCWKGRTGIKFPSLSCVNHTCSKVCP